MTVSTWPADVYDAPTRFSMQQRVTCVHSQGFNMSQLSLIPEKLTAFGSSNILTEIQAGIQCVA